MPLRPEKEEDAENELTLQQGNISIILEDYDDIFSDFDPRSYSQRGLSDDFLIECRRAALDKGIKEFELRLLVPREVRNRRDETIIIKRMRSYFQKHLSQEQHAIRAERHKGMIVAAVGAVLIFASTLLVGKDDLLSHFLFVISEPAGWFTIWTGFDKMFIDTAHHRPETEFHKRMARARVSFSSY